MTEIITFEQALERSGESKRFLLLGNGFSIACDPKIFNYESLYGEAAEKIKSDMPEVAALFDSIGTKDFEAVIRMLVNAAQVIPMYIPDDSDLRNKLSGHADSLKEILVSTIADNHPEYPGSIPVEKFSSCRRFLSHFLNPEINGKVYSLNYDLLLYWALMNEDADGFDEINLNINDGFGRDDDEDYIIWRNEEHNRNQCVYYLHGALHLFDAGTDLEKFTWHDKGVRLVDQAREALNNNKFPLFVAEGKSDNKLQKIKHQPYLHHGYKSFLQTVKEDRRKTDPKASKSLFIYGHSLDETDDHIIRKIGKGSISNLFISIYGYKQSDNNQRIISQANALKSLRDDKHSLNVNFYNADSAQVWAE